MKNNLEQAAIELLAEWDRCGHIDEMHLEPHIAALRAAIAKVTGEAAVLLHSMREVQHMLLYKSLNAPTQESRNEALKQLVQLAVPSHSQPKQSEAIND